MNTYSSIVGSGGSVTTSLTSNLTWTYQANPYNAPGVAGTNTTHLMCLSNNATIVETCCQQTNGFLVDGNGNATFNATTSVGWVNWCQLPETGTYNSHYNSEPALATKWGECFNATADPSKNPGLYTTNLTANSNVWICELTGNYSGSNPFGLPTLATTTGTGGAAKLGVVGLTMISAVVAISMLSLGA